MFESITGPGKFALLVSWASPEAADAWRPPGRNGLRHRVIRVVRDHGLTDRREAPQFHPAVDR